MARTVTALGVAALCLSACVSGQVPAEKLAAIKTIGIVSAVDETATRYSQAILVFGNEATEGDVRAWHLNDIIRKTAVDALSPRFRAIPLEANIAAFNDPLGHLEILTGSLEKNFASRLKAALRPGQPNVDAILVITAADLGGTPQNREVKTGLTIFSTVIGTSVIVPLSVAAMDGTTLGLLAFDYPTLPDRGDLSEHLPDTLKKDHWTDYTPAEREALRQIFVKLTVEGVRKSLQDMQFGGK